MLWTLKVCYVRGSLAARRQKRRAVMSMHLVLTVPLVLLATCGAFFDWLGDVGSSILNAAKDLIVKAIQLAVDVINWVIARTWDAAKDIVNGIDSVVVDVLNALGDVAGKLYDIVHGWINGVVAYVLTVVTWLVDGAKSIADAAIHALSGVVGTVYGYAVNLAGLRIGYGIGSDADLIANLDRVRTPFNVNCGAQAAALVALSDSAYLLAAVSATTRERTVLNERLKSLEDSRGYGLRIAPSNGNFLFIDTTRSSRDVAEALMQLGVIVKPWLELGFDTFIRVTVGRREDNEHFEDAFEQVMAAITPKAVLSIP